MTSLTKETRVGLVGNYKGTLARGLTQLLTGRAIAMTVQFITLALMGRVLGPSDFGIIQFGISAFIYLAFLNDMGLTILGARELRDPLKDAIKRGELVGVRVGLTAVALIPVGIVIASGKLGARDAMVAIILSTTLILSAFNLRWLLQAEERFFLIAATDTVAAIVQLAAMIVVVNSFGGVVAAAAVVVIGPAVSTILTVVSVGWRQLPRLRATRNAISLVRRATPLGIAVIATAIYYSVDSIILGVLRGSRDVGLYAAAYRIVLACLTVPLMAHAVALPLVSRVLHDDPDDIVPVLRAMSRGLLLFALPVSAGASLGAAMILTTVFGDAYGPAAGSLAILIWTTVTVASNVPFAILMLARHEDRRYMITTVLGAILNVAANVALIPIFGMLGAALSTMAAEIAVLAAILWFTRDVSVRILREAIRVALPPTIVMALALWAWRTEILGIAVSIATYTIVALMTRAIDRDELRLVFRMVAGRAASPVAGSPQRGGESQ